jgi:hypothetical protein
LSLKAQAVAAHDRFDAAATVMSAHDDMADLEHLDGELDHRQAIQIRVHDDVGDVAMHEQFPRQQVDDFIRGHAAVGAAYPQILRAIAGATASEKNRDPGAGCARPTRGCSQIID